MPFHYIDCRIRHRPELERDSQPFNTRFLMNFAGLPATTGQGSAYFVTTASTATITHSPKVATGRIIDRLAQYHISSHRNDKIGLTCFIILMTVLGRASHPFYTRFLMNFAGLPATTDQGSTSFVTTATIATSPLVTTGKIIGIPFDGYHSIMSHPRNDKIGLTCFIISTRASRLREGGC